MSAPRLAAPALAAGVLLSALVALAAASAPDLSDISLRGISGETTRLQTLIAAQPLTVLTFFSSTCPCFAAHRARLDVLVRETASRGVRFVVVDSERHSDGDSVPSVVPETGLPILRDVDARLARRLGARFATESFVFDATGALRYRGGIDDERRSLTATPKTPLRDQLLALLRGSAPAYATAKTLGCALRLR